MRRRPARPNGLLRSAPDAGNDDVEPALTRPFPAELDHLEEEHRVPLRFVSQIQDRTNDSQTTRAREEPFFTAKFQGCGLGLAAVEGLVRGHGGVIAVQSAPGSGTRVRILFPAAA
jgi:hypothetical protein